MGFDRLRRRCRGDGDDDEGAVVLLVAMSMTAIVILGSIVINLGGARQAREHDQDTADAMAIAGAAKLDPTGTNDQAACNAAWAYAMSNLNLSASPAPSCSTMAGPCVATTSRSVSVTSGVFTLTFVNPVLDTDTLFSAQPATSSDATPCERFGVRIAHTWHYPFGRGDPVLNVSAVARFMHVKGNVDAPLIVLNQHGCDVLTVSGNSHVSAVTSNGLPGYIAVDSDGAGCPAGNKVIVDAVGNAQVTAGAITMWALATGNTARAYDPADAGPGKAFNPIPVASSAPVGRTAVDWRYNCLAANGCPSGTSPALTNLIAADGGTGTPAGFTKWSTAGYSCTPGDVVVPRGNWYVDCPGGLNISGTVTFRGGDIVSDGPMNLSGSANLRVNCDAASSTTNCPANPSTPTTFYIRNGGISKAGTVTLTMIETFVYLANGTIDLSGNAALTWTAPSDPTYPFDDLLFWTENSSPIAMTGNASTNMTGVFFAPNATLTLTGNTADHAIQAQMWVNNLALVGNTDLTLAPRQDSMMVLGGGGGALIR